MIRIIALAMAGLLVSGPAWAHAANAAPTVPLDIAVDAAKIAVDSCKANGYNVMALVLDAANDPVVVLLPPGAPRGAEDAATRKAYTAIKLGISSLDFGASVGFRPTPRIPGQPPAAIPDYGGDPKLDPFGGAVPIRTGGQITGALAVAGAPGGEKDDACAEMGLAAISNRLR